jgi:hypothetical protein
VRAAAAGLLLFAAGCGGSPAPEADLDRGRRAVVAALDGWKASDPPARLKDLPDPILFTEELRPTHALTGYALGTPAAADGGVVRVPVTLSLRDRRGKPTTREAVYVVAPGPRLAVGRDPFE